jgi:hypothetical protein
MHRNLFAVWPLLAMLFPLAVGLPVHADCTAGHPNANVIESTPLSDFTDYLNGTVTHAKTGLMWKQCAEGQTWSNGVTCTGTATTANWADALKAANTANTAAFAGYTDWRLPNKKELASIVEDCGYEPAINQTAFPATPRWWPFWSGSSYAPNPAYAWTVRFQDYGGLTVQGYKASGNFVRLVRGGQFLDSFDLLKPYIDITPILMLLLD